MGFLDKLAQVVSEMSVSVERKKAEIERDIERGYRSVYPSNMSNQGLKDAYLACGSSAYERGKKKAYAEELQRRNLRP